MGPYHRPEHLVYMLLPIPAAILGPAVARVTGWSELAACLGIWCILAGIHFCLTALNDATEWRVAEFVHAVYLQTLILGVVLSLVLVPILLVWSMFHPR